MGRFENYTHDLLQRPEVRRLKRRKSHHFTEDRLAHSIATAKLAYRAARVLRADARVAARAGLLHDWFFEDRHEHRNRFGANVKHGAIAAANARGIGEPSAVTEAIATHMWGYVSGAPRSREAWIVWMADNVTWLTDAVKSLVRLLRKYWRRFLYGSSEKHGSSYAA